MGSGLGPDPAGDADAVEGPDAVRAGRLAHLPGCGARAPTSGTSTATRTSTTRWRSGPVILGYADPGGQRGDPRASSTTGSRFTLMHPLEVEVAERIVALVPRRRARALRASRARTPLTAAVRAGARLHRPRPWCSPAATTAGTTGTSAPPPARAGVPAGGARTLIATFRFNDLDASTRALEQHRGRVAAVVLEPSGADEPAPGYLEARASSSPQRHGALAVFDEVITGFRLAPGGAAGALRRRARPRLLRQGARQRHAHLRGRRCVGGDGASRGGVLLRHPRRRDAVARRGPGRARSIADGRVLAEIEQRGRQLRDGIARPDRGAWGRRACERRRRAPARRRPGSPGPSLWSTAAGSSSRLIDRSILFNGSMFVCARHTDADVAETLEAFDAALGALAEHDDVRHLLAGDPVQPVFPE